MGPTDGDVDGPNNARDGISIDKTTDERAYGPYAYVER
jgi:hypothetical protein